MSTNINQSLNNDFNKLLNERIIEKYILYGISLIGILINILIMIYLLIITSYKIKSSCFLFHHCIICLILSILCIPYSLSLSNYLIKCEYLGNIQVTCVTAQLLNISAMVASEAYRFEDLIHQDNSKDNLKDNSNDNNNKTTNYFQYQLKQSNKSTISCGCLSFGIIIIWFSSIILHLGITMIGSEKKSYYDFEGKYCYFIIRDIRGYVLTLMWIIITIFSLIITIRYIKKILNEVSKKRRLNQPLLSLALLGQSHGLNIANKDILMEQIQQRIKINILLIILFIIFWFPLFIITLWDIKFKINDFILRCLFLLAWSNSSISSLSYIYLLSKLNNFCLLCLSRKNLSTYDSLKSYYNRIGDRFHDISIQDNYNHQNIKLNKYSSNYLNNNSIFVKEISNNNQQINSSSSSLSLSSSNNKHFNLSNGLIVTNHKHNHL